MIHFGKLGLAAWIGFSACSLYGQTPVEPEAAAAPEVPVEPQEPDHVLTGSLAFSEADYEAAVAAFTRVTDRSPTIQNQLGVSYHLLNRLREAEREYRTLTSREGELTSRDREEESRAAGWLAALAAAYNNLGAIRYAAGDFGQAEDRFKDALELDPENRTLQQNLRAAKYARENGRQARAIVDDLKGENPLLIENREGDAIEVTLLMPGEAMEEAAMLELRGDSFLARKLYEDAIIEYQRAVDIDRYNATLVNKLGMAYHHHQELREAERYYRRALSLNPYFLAALNNLAAIEQGRERYDIALDYYRRALEIYPNSTAVLQNVGACFFAMERYQEGLIAYLTALRLDPHLFDRTGGGIGALVQTPQGNESMVNFYMAKVFASTGDADRTLSFLYRAVEEGFSNVQMILEDPDFELLAGDERFVQLVAMLEDG